MAIFTSDETDFRRKKNFTQYKSGVLHNHNKIDSPRERNNMKCVLYSFKIIKAKICRI